MVASQPAMHGDLHLRERHLGSAGELVAPGERRVVDREPRLREEPAGERAFVLGAGAVERLVREIDEAVGGATQHELRAVEVHVVEAQAAAE